VLLTAADRRDGVAVLGAAGVPERDERVAAEVPGVVPRHVQPVVTAHELV
jgi:hypothetical protein